MKAFFSKHEALTRRLENCANFSIVGMNRFGNKEIIEPLENFTPLNPDECDLGMEIAKLVQLHDSTKNLPYDKQGRVVAKLMGSVQCGCRFIRRDAPYYGNIGGISTAQRWVELRRFCCECNRAAPYSLRVDLPIEDDLGEARLWQPKGNVYEKTGFPLVNLRTEATHNEDEDRILNELRKKGFSDKLRFQRSFYYRHEVETLAKQVAKTKKTSLGDVVKSARNRTIQRLGISRKDYFVRTDITELELLEKTGRLEIFAECLMEMQRRAS